MTVLAALAQVERLDAYEMTGAFPAHAVVEQEQKSASVAGFISYPFLSI